MFTMEFTILFKELTSLYRFISIAKQGFIYGGIIDRRPGYE